MTIALKQTIRVGDPLKIIQCPYCGEGIYWAHYDSEICIFCYRRLPSSTCISHLVESRLDIYNEDTDNVCYGICY